MNLKSKTIALRLVEEDDAEFILKLRLDDRYNQYLSVVNPNIQAQQQWIKNYKVEEKKGSQFYFIIERIDGTRCGTLRLYDMKKDSFSWGSWILNDDKTRFAAIESALLVYEFGFENLNYSKSHFEVMKGNEKVMSFHRKMGAVDQSEDSERVFFEITKEAVALSKNKFLGKVL